MKKLLILSLLLAAGTALAQVTVQTRPGDGGVIWFDTNNNAIISGHMINTGAAPVLSACGTGSPTVVGSDHSGTVTTGTAATGCVITFNKAFSSAPSCVLGWSSGVLAAMSWVITTTTITITQTSATGAIIQYICIGKQ